MHILITYLTLKALEEEDLKFCTKKHPPLYVFCDKFLTVIQQGPQISWILLTWQEMCCDKKSLQTLLPGNCLVIIISEGRPFYEILVEN